MTKSLVPLVIASLFACGSVPCLATDAARSNAYTALRLMGKTLGVETLGRVVEVTGRGGTPQPASWRIVILDGTRGTREVKVAGGRIVSQKAFDQPSPLKTIRLEDLNLDSSGAFEAANTRARNVHVPFSAVNYALRVNDTTGKPVWDLELFNDAGTRVGGIRVAAHDGKLLAVNGLTPGQPPPQVAGGPDHDSVQATRVTPSRGTTTTTATTTYNPVGTTPPPPRDESEGGFFSRAGRTLDHTTDAVTQTLSRTGQAVDRSVRNTGEKLQRFLTRRHDPEVPSATGD